MYGYLGAPSYTVEMGRSFYEDCGVFAARDLPRELQRLPLPEPRPATGRTSCRSGPTRSTCRSAPARSRRACPSSVTATVDDNRYRYSNAGQPDILPPPYPVVYNIKSAKVYVDKLPWEDGAVGTAMTLVGLRPGQVGLPRRDQDGDRLDRHGQPGAGRAHGLRAGHQRRRQARRGLGAVPDGHRGARSGRRATAGGGGSLGLST